MVVLVTGGARSGKSRYAESRLAQVVADYPWLYVATAEALDAEMVERIARHQARRDQRWRTVEAPRDPAGALARMEGVHGALVDCVTLWVSNLLLSGATDDAILAAADGLGGAARAARVPVVIVTNEVGAGIVPEHAISRRFRDLAGLCNQRLAAAADEVVLVACGLPVHLKSP